MLLDVREIMVGDLVELVPIDREMRIKNGTSVIRVDSQSLVEMLQHEDILNFRIEAIPLSKDILAANGFSSATYCKYVDADKGVTVEICVDDGVPMYIHDNLWHYCVPCCNYVHELQRLFRKIGMDSMADNFKIK